MPAEQLLVCPFFDNLPAPDDNDLDGVADSGPPRNDVNKAASRGDEAGRGTDAGLWCFVRRQDPTVELFPPAMQRPRSSRPAHPSRCPRKPDGPRRPS
jgi:hypothetical protein